MTTKRKQRTSQQNKALHKWFDMVADALNDAGWSVNKVLESKLIRALRAFTEWMRETSDSWIFIADKLDELIINNAQTVEIPWNGTLIKELIYRPVMQAMTGHKSTTELNTVDPSEIYEVLNRHLGEKLKIHVPWPSEETR